MNQLFISYEFGRKAALQAAEKCSSEALILSAAGVPDKPAVGLLG
jgi:hypothetical protein